MLFRSWKKDRSTDFSCNLFYSSADIDLGIRYIPSSLDTDPDPITTLVDMTKDNKFTVVYEDKFSMDKFSRLAVRALSMKERGWTYPGPLLTTEMWTYIGNQLPEEMAKRPILESL